jgi:hypothetical protein
VELQGSATTDAWHASSEEVLLRCMRVPLEVLLRTGHASMVCGCVNRVEPQGSGAGAVPATLAPEPWACNAQTFGARPAPGGSTMAAPSGCAGCAWQRERAPSTTQAVLPAPW